MGEVPAGYKWLKDEKGPLVLKEALRLYGTLEVAGPMSNPEIIRWAKEVNDTVGDWYTGDDKAWCGLFVAVCLRRAGYVPPNGFNALRALYYAHWGRFIPSEKDYCIGDIGIFTREGGGHVGFLVGQDHDAVHVLGGNQGNKVGIDRLKKERLHAVVRCPYKTFKPSPLPALRPSGGLSYNEA
jgi:uncharacterized protein (TIGR02594 family)